MENTSDKTNSANMTDGVFNSTDNLISIWQESNPKQKKIVNILKLLPIIAIVMIILLIVIMYFKSQAFKSLEIEEQIASQDGFLSLMKFLLVLIGLMSSILLYGKDIQNDYILYNLANWLRKINFDDKSYFSYLKEQNIDYMKDNNKYGKSIEAAFISKSQTYLRVMVFKLIWFIVMLIIAEIFVTTTLFEQNIKMLITSSNAGQETEIFNIVATVIIFGIIALPGIIIEVILSIKAPEYVEKLMNESN